MKLLKKKVARPFRHVYTEDDYKWVGRRKNYEVTLRRITEETTKYYFIINDKSDNALVYNSRDDGNYFESLENVEKAAIEYVDKKLY